MTEQKLCRDCRWRREVEAPPRFGTYRVFNYCERPGIPPQNSLTPQAALNHCHEERESGDCGPEGTYFQEKP